MRCRGDAELFEFFAGKVGQAGDEGFVGFFAVRFNGPIFLRFKGFNGQLALNDQAQCRALHATGGQAPPHLAPEQR